MRKIYRLEGIDDSMDAKKIEECLLNDPLIDKAIVDVVGQKLFITYKEEELSLSSLQDLIHKVDINVTIIDDDKKEKVEKKVESSVNKGENFMIIRLVIASVALAFGYFWKLSDTLRIIIFIASYLCAGYDVFINLVKDFIKKKFFSPLLLIVVASIGAFIIKSYPEAALVMIIFQIGNLASSASIEYAKKKMNVEHDEVNKEASLKEVLIKDKESKIKIGKILNILVKYYIPVILVIALFVLLIPKMYEVSGSNYAYSAFIILVSSSPFSFIISASLSKYVGYKILEKQGIIINDLNKEDDLDTFDFTYFDLEKVEVSSSNSDSVASLVKSTIKKIQKTAFIGMFIALIIKLACYVLVILGDITMWIALLANIIILLVAILNAMKLENKIGVKKENEQ